MMSAHQIEVVIRELARLQERLLELKAERKSNPSAHISGTRASGAVRRASLDVTRALADLRRTR